MRKNNINQEIAIRHGNGPCLVVAGPGSGKTYVLINRVLNLIDSIGVNPENILVITFTRAAANEMRQRFINLVNEELGTIDSMPKFGTFHSVFYDILKSNFGYAGNSLLNSDEEKKLLSEVIYKHRKLKVSHDFINNVLKDIKYYKLSLEKNEKFVPNSMDKRIFLRVYQDYQEKLFYNKKLDFSDMIFKCYELLKSNKKILAYYQKQFKYILIDEFQDINRIQYDLVRLVCKSKNIFVVGDDDQSIYSFRGSQPGIMTDFLKDYKNTKIINLNENYRCARQIVKFSKLVIDCNKERFDKNLVSNRKELGQLEIKAFVDASEENNYIVSLIKKYRRLGIKLSDMAILYRTNILANSIKAYLDKYNISYKVKKEDNNVDDHVTLGGNEKTDRDSVNLMTFHLSKGLEFDTVFIIDANDGLIPHKKTIRENDLETEIRLFYVAMTRAKNNLHIFFTTRRFGKDFKPSRFILEALGGQNE